MTTETNQCAAGSACGATPRADWYPVHAGLGLQPKHYDDALHTTAMGIWYEVHAENYMVAGGPRLAWLHTIRERHPVSLHGVGLSLGSDADPDRDHLEALRRLIDTFEPFLVSEHLAWSSHAATYLPDLLPIPRTRAALTRVAENIARTQEVLGRTILIENPSHYLRIADHAFGEIEFLTLLAQRTGCGLLLDVNNVWVSANNLGFDAAAYIDAFPADKVGEIHLAGHSFDPVHGRALLIDSHDAPVDSEVWQLYQRAIRRVGPRPTLIERDGNLPDFATLLEERLYAEQLLSPAATPVSCAART